MSVRRSENGWVDSCRVDCLCQRRRLKSDSVWCSRVCVLGVGVGEEDKGEGRGFEGYVALVGALVTRECSDVEVTFETPVDFKLVTEGLGK